MSVFVVAVILCLFRHVYSAPTASTNSSGSCIDFTLPVTVTAQNAEYNLLNVHDNIDAIAWVVDLTRHTSPTPQERLIRNITVSGTYNISAKLCIPQKGNKRTHLQIATHGLAFDKKYWDVSVDASEYSYVQHALDAGYSILTYDRLGTGLSDKPDGRSVVQAPLELEILREITQLARNGQMMKYARGTGHNATTSIMRTAAGFKFEKFIHVGHSFGSLLTTALLANYGNLSDAAVVTGFILNRYLTGLNPDVFDLQYAAQSNPQRFGDRGSNYLALATQSALQAGFFSTRRNVTTGLGGFDPKILDYGFSITQTITTTEMISSMQVYDGVASHFHGKLQFVIAEFDYLVCDGDCRGVYDTAMIQSLYPNLKSTDFEFYVQPGTGHALTMHRNATIGYKATFDFLDKNGL